MSSGRIVQIIGAVIDVEFPRDSSAAGIRCTESSRERPDSGSPAAAGRRRGSHHCHGFIRGRKPRSVGGKYRCAISVPVGIETLGRIMDVLGNPIDECGPIGEKERASIHRKAPQAYEELSASDELLETGIKVIDLVCPFAKGGKVGLFGGAGVLARPST